MKRLVAWSMATMTVVGAPLAASAQSSTDRRWHIDAILAEKDASTVQRERAQCALGKAPAMIANGRGAGAATLPDAAPWCIAVLTRVGRGGELSYVRDPANPTLTPALAFDNGFVSGWTKQASIPADAPSMAALQPVAERCLGQHEPDTDLCNAAGYAIGARAAHGELPSVS